MSAEGYVKVHRSLLDWGWYTDIPTRVLFDHLLLVVNWKPGVFLGQAIDPGSVVTSHGKLAQETGLTEKQVRRALGNLESTGEIVIGRAGRGQLVTLANWAKYQGDDENGAASGQRQGRDRAETGQAKGRQRATIEEGKKGRRKEGKKVSEPEGSVDPVLEGLEVEDKAPPAPRADRRDPDVQAVIDHLTERLKASGLAPSLDPDWITGKDGRRIDGNRAAAKHLLTRLAKEHPEYEPTVSACRLIDYVMSHPFHGPRSTRVAYLYRNLSAITADAKTQRTNGKGQPTADKVREGLDLLRAGHLREA